MRRHPDIHLLRRAGDVAQLVARQRRILDALWRLLRPGGKLLYATCSLLPEENEEQVGAFLARQPDARALPLSFAPGLPTDHGLQLLPLTKETDGFYYALLEKRPA
jgi:16S rRNA (cytosine967-C5)-methyltransferase